MIGKYENPRCFHHVSRKKLPVLYQHSKNAWMTGTIFSSWFHSDFVPAVRKHLRRNKLPETAVLLLDNCPAHPPAETLCSKGKNHHITVYYLPKNTTSKIQPLDQGIIHSFKDKYRAALTKSFLQSGSSKVEEFLKHHNLKDALYLIDHAWTSVTQQTIYNCWNRGLGAALPTPDNPDQTSPDSDSDSEEDDFLGFTQQEIAELELKLAEFKPSPDTTVPTILSAWAACDEDVPTVSPDSDEEPEEPEPAPEPSTSAEPDIPRSKFTPSQAVEAVQGLLYFAECQGFDTVDLIHLQNFQRKCKKIQFASGRQLSIAEAFSRGSKS